DHKQHAARRMCPALAFRRHLDLERQRARLGGYAGWPALDVAGERPAVAVGDEVEHAVAAVAGAARGDDLDQAAEPALGVLLRQPGDLGVERRLGLPLDE